MSPHDILTAYSEGRITSSEAIDQLHLDGYRDLVIAIYDAGHPLPVPSQAEISRQVAAALPLLREALIVDRTDASDA
jgi:hypothetical protein